MEVSFQDSRSYLMTANDLFHCSLSALRTNQNILVENQDINLGIIIASKGPSLLTWGHKIEIQIKSNDTMNSTVSVSSSAKGQIIDYGTNKKIVGGFFAALNLIAPLSNNQPPAINNKKLYSLFYLWFIVNSITLIVSNVLVAFAIQGLGLEESLRPNGYISYIILGGVIGLLVGTPQWFILNKYFSISPAWIFSCVLGFATMYTLNWYSGAILMGLFQQVLIRAKVKDSFLWIIISVACFGLNRLLFLRLEAFCFYGAIYALPTAILLFWYKDKLLARQQDDMELKNISTPSN